MILLQILLIGAGFIIGGWIGAGVALALALLTEALTAR